MGMSIMAMAMLLVLRARPQYRLSVAALAPWLQVEPESAREKNLSG